MFEILASAYLYLFSIHTNGHKLELTTLFLLVKCSFSSQFNPNTSINFSKMASTQEITVIDTRMEILTIDQVEEEIYIKNEDSDIETDEEMDKDVPEKVYGYNEKTDEWHCGQCGISMGRNNPRQLCAKWYCAYE